MVPTLTKSAANLEVECKALLRQLVFRFPGTEAAISRWKHILNFVLDSTSKHNVDFGDSVFPSIKKIMP